MTYSEGKHEAQLALDAALNSNIETAEWDARQAEIVDFLKRIAKFGAISKWDTTTGAVKQ